MAECCMRQRVMRRFPLLTFRSSSASALSFEGEVRHCGSRKLVFNEIGRLRPQLNLNVANLAAQLSKL